MTAKKHRGHVSAGHGRVGKHRMHPGGRGLVGVPSWLLRYMCHFHLTRNAHWRPIINVDKLWSLIPAEEKGLTADSDVVPVIDTLRFGYGKVLGNGVLPKLPFIEAGGVVSLIA
ncbi:ribosomal protein L18e/L15P [Mycena maculata]|uniref:Ribosomal protein L18e/L15P n=1 Tax=Mycena maculata TaxID=230809 RepID=A0AAD7I760_9AGAR|nr:ribosomal protein L18e/L15P [Mycena maculata]